MQNSIRLGINIDHVATLRQVRQARYPDIVEAMHLSQRGGADQITVHLREDRRHIQDEDVTRLLEASLMPINLEIAFIDEMSKKAMDWKPYSVTLVPERREEMTTESGLDLEKLISRQSELHDLKSETRLIAFIDASVPQVELAQKLGFDGVEFHTGPYASLFEEALRGRKKEAALEEEIERLFSAADHAKKAGLQVKAGHGLTIQNVESLREMPGLEELNIGHAIVARAILIGLEAAVREMKSLMF